MNILAGIDLGLSSNDERTRWEAAEAAGKHIDRYPWEVWDLILRHGSSTIEDTRAAVATCMLEHLLEKQFQVFFPLLESEVRSGNALLGDTLRRCWKLGASEESTNSKRWDNLVREAKQLGKTRN